LWKSVMVIWLGFFLYLCLHIIIATQPDKVILSPPPVLFLASHSQLLAHVLALVIGRSRPLMVWNLIACCYKLLYS
jgi:hypothetical protein